MLRYLLVCVGSLIGSWVYGQDWEEQLNQIRLKPQAERAKHIEEIIKQQQQLPLRYDQGQVVFLHHSPLARPKILSGFNGFLSRRYIKDPNAGAMHQIVGTNWYYHTETFPQDARIFYQFEQNGAIVNDPLNPKLGYRFTLINSELRMPDFKIAPELIRDQSIAVGEVNKITLPSKHLNQEREVHIYTPANYEPGEGYPLVMFHDGNAYIETAAVPQILDYLIAHQKIRPLIAVFDEPQARGEEYRGKDSYLEYVDKELIPYVSEHYSVSAGNSAVIGGSRGGLSSLILAHSLDKFSKVGAFSPAIHPQTMKDFEHFLTNSPHHPSQVAILGARYDKVWYPDALALKAYFSKPAVDLHYLDINQGHNIQAWIGYLDEFLQHFYGLEM